MRAILTLTIIILLAMPRLALAQRIAPVAFAQSSAVRATAWAADSEPAGQRSLLRYPLIGAVVGGIGFQLYYARQCRRDSSDGCMGGLAPLGLGAVVGAAAGAIVELLWRSVDAH